MPSQTDWPITTRAMVTARIGVERARSGRRIHARAPELMPKVGGPNLDQINPMN